MTYGCYPGTSIPRRAPPKEEHQGKGVCKWCGAGDLFWEQRDVGWRLCHVGGALHVCAPRNLEALEPL